MRIFRLLRLHWFTWLVLLFEAGFFGAIQFACAEYVGFSYGRSYGWPVDLCRVNPTPEWQPGGLAYDLGICAAIVVSAAVMTERCVRARRARRFRWCTVPLFLVATGVLYGLIASEAIPGAEAEDLSEMLRNPIAFYFTTAIVLSVGCAIYMAWEAALWLAVGIPRITWRTAWRFLQWLESLSETTHRRLVRGGASILGVGFLVAVVAAVIMGRRIAHLESAAETAHWVALHIMLVGFCLLLAGNRRSRVRSGTTSAAASKSQEPSDSAREATAPEDASPTQPAVAHGKPGGAVPSNRGRWGFLLVASLLTIVLGSIAWRWYAPKAREVRQQRAAVAAVEAAGGWIQSEVTSPAWIRRILGTDFYVTYIQIRLKNATDDAVAHLPALSPTHVAVEDGTGITDMGLHFLGKCGRLEGLALPRARITDAGLVQLKTLSRLQHLDLSHTPITGVGLAELQGRPLRELRLDATQVTDAGLRHLKGLRWLHILDLSQTPITGVGLAELRGLSLYTVRLNASQVTDEGLAALRGFTGLSALELDDAPISGTGLIHVRGLSTLVSLQLGGSHLTDAGLATLQELRQLKHLGLHGPRVTDGTLVHLRGLPELESLYLEGTATTDAGLLELRQLPRLHELRLSDTNVTDAGLAHLQALAGRGHGPSMNLLLAPGSSAATNFSSWNPAHPANTWAPGNLPIGLVFLELAGPQFTDEGLVHLEALPQLDRVILSCPNITEAGVQKLRGALPALSIEDILARDRAAQ
jgi:internalin A